MKKIFFVLTFVLLLCTTSNIFAQGDATHKQATVVSNTNVYDAYISAQLQDKMTVEFTVQNDFDRVQGDIHYDVRLYEKNTGAHTGTLADRFTNNDVFSLAPQQSVHKTVEYSYPGNLNGDYDVWVFVYTTANRELGFAKAGTISVQGTKQTVQIDKQKCFLSIEGVDEKFDLLQGVDINAQKEKLLLTCTILNDSDVQTITTQYKTTQQTQYGKEIKTNDNNYTFTIQKNETKDVVFFVPMPVEKKPGAYDTVLTLYNTEHKKIDAVRFHYVIQGESASIQSIHLNQSSYKKGDRMIIDIAWSGSADTFDGSRVNQKEIKNIIDNKENVSSLLNKENYIMKVNVVDDDGSLCIEDIEQKLNTTRNVVINKTAIHNCNVPHVSATILDDNGSILAKYSIPFDAQTQNVHKEQTKNDFNNIKHKLSLKLLLMIIIAILPIIILIIFLFRKRKLPVGIFLAMFLIPGFLLQFNVAEAVKLEMDYVCRSCNDTNGCNKGAKLHPVYNMWMYPYDGYENLKCKPNANDINWFNGGRVLPVTGDSGEAVVVTDKTTYTPGEKITVSATGAYTVKCSNSAPVIIAARIDSNPWTEIIHEKVAGDNVNYNKYNLTPKSKDFGLPNDCGPHVLDIYFRLTHGGIMTRYSSIPFTINCSVNAKLSATASNCAVSEPGDPDSGRGTAVATISDVTGNATGAINYQFKCGAQNWTAWTTANQYTCHFDEPGTYVIRGKVKRGTTESDTTPVAVNVDIPECSLDGKCTSASPYTYNANQTTWPAGASNSTYFCESGTPTITPTQSNFPNYGQTVTWDCIGKNGGTSTQNGACKAIRKRPKAECKTGYEDNNQNQNIITNTEPTNTSNLCKSGVFSWNNPKLGSDGWWHWQCEHDPQANPRTVNCKAPTCLANMPIKYTNPVIISNNMKTNISISCPNTCCKIHNTTKGSIPEKTICTGDSGEIEIVEGENEFDAECWFDKNNSKTKDPNEPPVKKDFKVQTACIESQCTANGTCAKAPKIANSRSKCKSSCNSNADCTSGRIIETRP